MQKRNSFLVGKAFKAYLLATVLTVAATQIASMVDASLVGQLISAEALGAVNFSKPILQLTFSLGNLFIIGGSILAGMAIGSGNREQANRIFTKSVMLVAIVGILILTCGLLFFEPILSFLCNSENLRPMAGDYMRIMYITMLPFLLSYVLETFVIVDGAPKLATIAVIIGNVMNVILDVLFISVFKLGVEGAATATLIMYIVTTLILLLHFVRKNENKKIFTLDFNNEKGIVQKMVMMGLPFTITTFLIAVQIALCNKIAIQYLGDCGVITFAVCIALLAFSMIFVAGTMRTIQPVGAILKGMGDSKGILLMMGSAYKFLAICLIIFTGLILIIPDQISNLFGVNDSSMLPVVSKALPVFTLYIILEGIYSLFIPAYQFYDHNNIAMYVALSKSIFPMIGFWIMAAFVPSLAWWGFFFGQAAVILILLPFIIYEKRKNNAYYSLFLIPLQSQSEVFDISIPSNVKNINDATDGLLNFLTQNDVSNSKANYSVLCCEELIKNIIEHSTAHFIDVRALIRDNNISISLHDDGVAFNPIKTTDKDQIGLSLVRKIISDIKYDYTFNQNMVTIEIKQ